ncbi:uncharacterized protein LOC114003785 isoform X2 [Pipra filicauda]|uniref:Uncharacterized protein LOC114003785 isoform X2 n=1 Tax=Pipra filicauda TaxID=649802 RepID=A0A7R5L7M8_9PASS|nr:uncharacterized protein LOC114003785 isoform X2 [Pipra filicauda]
MISRNSFLFTHGPSVVLLPFCPFQLQVSSAEQHKQHVLRRQLQPFLQPGRSSQNQREWIGCPRSSVPPDPDENMPAECWHRVDVTDFFLKCSSALKDISPPLLALCRAVESMCATVLVPGGPSDIWNQTWVLGTEPRTDPVHDPQGMKLFCKPSLQSRSFAIISSEHRNSFPRNVLGRFCVCQPCFLPSVPSFVLLCLKARAGFGPALVQAGVPVGSGFVSSGHSSQGLFWLWPCPCPGRSARGQWVCQQWAQLPGAVLALALPLSRQECPWAVVCQQWAQLPGAVLAGHTLAQGYCSPKDLGLFRKGQKDFLWPLLPFLKVKSLH